MVSLTHETLPQYEKIAFQCVAYKKDRLFTLQAPVSVSRKLDLTKFHKYHCFRPGIYFETPVLEIPIVTDGVAHRPLEVNAAEVASAMQGTVKIRMPPANCRRNIRSIPEEKGNPPQLPTILTRCCH